MSRKYKKLVIAFLIIGISGVFAGCSSVLESVCKNMTGAEAKSYEEPGANENPADGQEENMEERDFEEEVLSEISRRGNEETPDEETPDEEDPDKEKKDKEAQSGLYYYETLTPEQQDIYVQIYESITTREDGILSSLDVDAVDKVYQCVMMDHPEIFYSAGYELEKQLSNDRLIRLTFRANYHMTESEVVASQMVIDNYVQSCLLQMPQGMDQYGQVKYIYEYVISNTEYELYSENNQNICSVFINGKSVCQGYAKAAQYLLRELGFEITLAAGKVENGDLHTWNLVRVDGDYYYMDPTWGDAGYLNQDSDQSQENIQPVNYEYFLITTEQLSKTHIIDNIAPLPACVATRNNFYVREGLYFTGFEEQKMTDAFERAYGSGQGYVTVMCSDVQVYEEMKQRMISDQEVFRYLHSSQSVSYSYNDDLYTLIFWLG